jgi:predicted lipid carrier protein YhbT/chorismate mutase
MSAFPLPRPWGFAARLPLARAWIDHADATIIRLAASRRHAAVWAACDKPAGGGRDLDREAAVLHHMVDEARAWGLPEATAEALARLLIRDACHAQGLPTEPAAMLDDHDALAPPAWKRHLAALLPPPARWRPLGARLPPSWSGPLLVAAAGHALARALEQGEFGFLEGRRLGIEVQDLGLAWTLGLRDGRLVSLDGPAEATVRGGVVDLLLLASRLEDADTLFFQRRLVLVGDTALGLEARNVLDRLDWAEVPLALRVPLHRSARLLRELRELSRERQRAKAPASAPDPPPP